MFDFFFVVFGGVVVPYDISIEDAVVNKTDNATNANKISRRWFGGRWR